MRRTNAECTAVETNQFFTAFSRQVCRNRGSGNADYTWGGICLSRKHTAARHDEGTTAPQPATPVQHLVDG